MRSLSRIAAIFSKELAQLRRDRMTFGMVIMIPLIQLILFGYAINTNIRDIPVAVVDHSQTGLSRTLIQMVEATRVVKVTERLSSVQEAEDAIKSARVRAAFILPDDLSQRIARSPAVGLGTPASTDEETSRPVAQWVVDGSDTMIAGAIKGPCAACRCRSFSDSRRTGRRRLSRSRCSSTQNNALP